MRCAIVIEHAGGNLSAYVPDLPGCVSTAATVEEITRAIREAIELNLEGMHTDGESVPAPSSRVGYVEIVE